MIRGNSGMHGVIRADNWGKLGKYVYGKFTEMNRSMQTRPSKQTLSSSWKFVLAFFIVTRSQDIQNRPLLCPLRSRHRMYDSRGGKIDIRPTLLRLTSIAHSEHKVRQ